MRILKFTAIVFLQSVCITSLLRADVIRLQNGDIYLGNLISADSGGIVIESFGEQRKFSQSEVLKNEKNLDSIKNIQSDITLRDGSVIKGKIENYDEEVGILVNIDFGEITLPVKSIHGISDPVRKKYYNGNTKHIGADAGYYMLAGKLADKYNPGFTYSLFAEFYSGFIDGLFIGGDLTFIPADYKDSSKVSYNILSLQPYAMYRFLFLRRGSTFMKDFIPFASIGLGASYVIMKDDRSGASSREKSEIDLTYSTKIGCDYQFMENLGLRISAGLQSVIQKEDSFNMILFNAGVLYSF